MSKDILQRLEGCVGLASDMYEEEMLAAIAEIKRLRGALTESLSLQCHYANLLNGWDGGNRLQFTTINEWLARLAR